MKIKLSRLCVFHTLTHFLFFLDCSVFVVYTMDNDRPPDTPCPNGFLCEESNNYGRRMSNCTDVQQLPKQLKLGNLYAGISCPENEPLLMNCPLGSYCPTPDVILPCPAGSFCPHKSDQPWITCKRCKEGSLEIKRDAFGYVFFSLVIVVLILASFVMKHKEYQSNVFAKQLELLARQADSFNISKRRKLRQEQLERLKPKLDILARRLEKTHHVSMSGRIVAAPNLRPPEETTVSSNSVLSPTSRSTDTAHSTIFDTRKLYDLLDKDGNGKISYQELNVVLDLNQHELQNFVRRMRELGQMDDSNNAAENDSYNNHSNQDDTVSRAVFVKNFLHVLDETTQLSVTTQEAAALWDQIEAENGSKGYVDESMLYSSSISTFLNDRQIYLLLKVCFRVCCIFPAACLLQFLALPESSSFIPQPCPG
jgi:hypothetical protein